MNKLAFIDLETTGLNEAIHEICEIAIIADQLTYVRKVTLLRPDLADPIALKINGYNLEDWKDSFHPSVIASEVSFILRGYTIVAHNPSFDIAFLVELLHTHGQEITFQRRSIDTIVLAHEHLQPCGLKSLSLDNIRKFLGWSSKNSHTALKDAKDVRSLYYLLIRATFFRRLKWTFKAYFSKLRRLLF